MEIGILGYPKAGKSTVFNVLARREGGLHSPTSRPNLGVAKVPDARIDTLSSMFQPQRTVYAEIQYADIPGTSENFSAGLGIHGESLNQLQRSDALLHVVRGFTDPAVPVSREAESLETAIPGMELELAMVDLAILERRLERLQAMEKGAKPQERSALKQERSLLARIKEALEGEVPVRAQSFSVEELRLLANYQLLTAKPFLVVLNLGEEELQYVTAREAELRERFSGPGVSFVALCGKLEMELSQLLPEEEEEFRQSLGARDAGRERALRASYELLGLVSFFTVGADEVRAWTVPRDILALKAAGKVHSDIEQGFIRAELVAFTDLVQCGSLPEARKQGLLRKEGKTYPVKDGDVINFLFNV